MDVAIVGPTFPLNAVPHTLCDNEISAAWCLASCSSTVVLGDRQYADS